MRANLGNNVGVFRDEEDTLLKTIRQAARELNDRAQELRYPRAWFVTAVQTRWSGQ